MQEAMVHLPETTPTTGEMAAAISNAVVAIIRGHCGKGPERARTVLDPSMAVTLLRGGFSTAERTLHQHGMDDVVETGRSALQEIMRRELVSAVETITGRTVESLLSSVDHDREIQTEIFVFAPETDT